MRTPKASVDAFIKEAPRDIKSKDKLAKRRESLFTWRGTFKRSCPKCGIAVAAKQARVSNVMRYFVSCKNCGPLSRNFESREDMISFWDGEQTKNEESK